MINNIPYTKAYIKNNYIKNTLGLTECYIVAVTTMLNRPHLFTVHTIDGALYSRLPIQAFVHKDISNLYREFDCYSGKLNLDEYGTISSNSQVIQLNYLKDYEVNILTYNMSGRYLFSIEPTEGAFSEDPEQSKLLHFIKLDNGQFGIFPNNKLKFMDNYFTKESQDIYNRTTNYYTINE